MQPTWLAPFGSLAQKEALGMFFASLPASGFAFQGRRKLPISISSTSVPSTLGFDHGQQKPAVSRAVKPSAIFAWINTSSASAVSTIPNSNKSVDSNTVGDAEPI